MKHSLFYMKLLQCPWGILIKFKNTHTFSRDKNVVNEYF